MPVVTAVHRSPVHAFSKDTCDSIELVADFGVVDDAHAGALVKHRSRVRREPSQANLRQVHLLHAELLSSLSVEPGALGENVTTSGVDLLGLSRGTRLHLGPDAVVEVTGLRNPCQQIEDFRAGLLSRVLVKQPDGSVQRLVGVMSVVLAGGVVRAGDAIVVEAPAVFEPLPVV